MLGQKSTSLVVASLEPAQLRTENTEITQLTLQLLRGRFLDRCWALLAFLSHRALRFSPSLLPARALHEQFSQRQRQRRLASVRKKWIKQQETVTAAWQHGCSSYPTPPHPTLKTKHRHHIESQISWMWSVNLMNRFHHPLSSQTVRKKKNFRVGSEGCGGDKSVVVCLGGPDTR